MRAYFEGVDWRTDPYAGFWLMRKGWRFFNRVEGGFEFLPEEEWKDPETGNRHSFQEAISIQRQRDTDNGDESWSPIVEPHERG